MKKITVHDIAMLQTVNRDIISIYILEKGDMYNFKIYHIPQELYDYRVQSIAPSDDGERIEVRINPLENYDDFKLKYKRHLVMNECVPVDD